MAVVINELEVSPPPPERSAPAVTPETLPIKTPMDPGDVANAVRQHAERLARVRAD